MRPAFIAELAEVYGEPRINIEAESLTHTEFGRAYRRCWVWFLPIGGRLSNHNIHIDRYANGRWELGVGCHCSCKQLTSQGRAEPTDADARDLLALAGWPNLAQPPAGGESA